MSKEQCPKCGSKNIYYDQVFWNCPECFHEWNDSDKGQISEPGDELVKND